MDARRLRTVIRWACVPIVSVLGVVVAMGAALIPVHLLGVPRRSVVPIVFCVLAPMFFVVSGALIAPSHRIAVAGGAGFIVSIIAGWVVLSWRDPTGLLFFAAAIGTVILVVRQDGYGARVADWPMLRPAYASAGGTCERALGAPQPFVWTKTADEIFASVKHFCRRISGTAH